MGSHLATPSSLPGQHLSSRLVTGHKWSLVTGQTVTKKQWLKNNEKNMAVINYTLMVLTPIGIYGLAYFSLKNKMPKQMMQQFLHTNSQNKKEDDWMGAQHNHIFILEEKAKLHYTI